MTEHVTLGSIIGHGYEEDFLEFDLTEIQGILANLQNTDTIDLAHVEFLQQQTLRGADVLTEHLGKIVKTTSYLETKANAIKNRVARDYEAPNGAKTTIDMRKFAAESSSEVEEVQVRLAKAKASKIVLEKKLDILIRAHHHYKDIAAGLKRTVLGYNTPKSAVEGY